jgi:flagellar hook-associated protein 3 FlgL
MRVSSTQIARSALYSVGTAYSRFDEAQRIISTGKQLQAPSDDPAGMAQALSFRKQMSDLDQYGRTMDQAKGFMATAETALDSITTLVRQARAIGVQGATDSITTETRVALANQIQNIIKQLGNIGNTSFGSRFVFAGQLTQTPPLLPNGNTFDYVGGTTAKGNADIVLDIGTGESLTVNVTGDQIFSGLLTALGDLRDHVSVGDSQRVSREDLAALDGELSNLLSARADIGSKIQRIDITRSRNELTKVNFTEFISNIEDADIPKAIVELQIAETAYQAALEATTRAFQSSLLDYLHA